MRYDGPNVGAVSVLEEWLTDETDPALRASYLESLRLLAGPEHAVHIDRTTLAVAVERNRADDMEPAPASSRLIDEAMAAYLVLGEMRSAERMLRALARLEGDAYARKRYESHRQEIAELAALPAPSTALVTAGSA